MEEVTMQIRSSLILLAAGFTLVGSGVALAATSAPTGFAATVNGTTVDLTWDPYPISGFDSSCTRNYNFKIEREDTIADNDGEETVPWTASTTSFADENVPAGTYDYKLRAECQGPPGTGGPIASDWVYVRGVVVEAGCTSYLEPVCTFTTSGGVTSVTATWCDVLSDVEGETKYKGDLEKWLAGDTDTFVDDCFDLSRIGEDDETEVFGYTCDGETCTAIEVDVETASASACSGTDYLKFAIFKEIDGDSYDDNGFLQTSNEAAKVRVPCTAAQ
jgi:hypothetical protein